MLFSASTLLFLFNLAVASLLCAGVTLCVGSCYRALPKRHATLIVGLIACVSSFVLVGLGSLLSLGQFSSFSDNESEMLTSNASNLATLTQPMPSILTEEADLNSNHLSALPTVEPTFQPVLEPLKNDQAFFDNEDSPSGSNRAFSTTIINGTQSEAPLSPVTDQATADWQATLLKIGSSLTSVWLVGSLFFCVLRLRDWFRCRRLIHHSRLNDDHDLENQFSFVANELQLRCKPKLLVSDGLAAPIVVGIFQPVVVLPADVDQLFSTQQLRSVLVHELSHVARKDHWVVGLQILATSLYWWNPLVWLISNKVAEVRELICDDIAVQAQNKPREYAQSIIAMAERVVSQTEMLAPLGISRSSASELERRIRRIISTRAAAMETRLSRWSIAGVSLFASLLAVGLLFAQVPSENAQAMQAGETETVDQKDTSEVSNKFGKPADEANRISGQVIQVDGQPASNAKVRMVGNKMSDVDITVVTDSAGKFDFTVHFERSKMWYSQVLG